MVRRTLATLLLLGGVMLATRAAAQCFDDPRLIEPCEIADEPHVVVLPAVRPAAPPPRTGAEVSLGAGYGYGGTLMLFGDRWSGPVATASLSILWPPHGRDAWLGIRLLGSYGHQMNGTREGWFLSRGKSLSGWHATWSAAFAVAHALNDRVLVDIYTGLGAIHVRALVRETDGAREDSYILPELTFGSGLDVRLTRFLDLRLGLDLGTCFFATWRIVGSGGILLRF